MRQYLFLHQGVLEKHWQTSHGRWWSPNLQWQITISGGRTNLDHLHIFSTPGYWGLWSQVFRGTLLKLFLRRLTHGCFSPLMISGALLPKKTFHSLFLLMCRMGWRCLYDFLTKFPPLWYISTPSGRILARHGKISRKELEKRLAGIKAEGEEGQVKSYN